MSYQEPLSQKAVGISISESSDMSLLGLSQEHLRDAMSEVARHLLAMGARLVYGGDLRAHGFTELLFELVARHRRDADVGDRRPAVLSYLSWPVHSRKPAKEIKLLERDLRGLVEVHYLDQRGRDLARGGHTAAKTKRLPTNEEWEVGLTAQRKVLTHACDARIALGGRTSEFKGKMPGIAEEALCSLSQRQPLFLLGGFGGCARDIAEDLDLLARRPGNKEQWVGRENFAGLSQDALRNGLNVDENATLAQTVHVDQAVALVLRGLLRLFARTGS